MPPSDQTDPPHTAVYVGEAPAAQQAPASGPPPTYLEAIDPNGAAPQNIQSRASFYGWNSARPAIGQEVLTVSNLVFLSPR